MLVFNIPTDLDYLTFRGNKRISFRKMDDGEIVGTGILNPLLEKFRLLPMLVFQVNTFVNIDTIPDNATAPTIFTNSYV